jgi:cytochrome P450
MAMAKNAGTTAPTTPARSGLPAFSFGDVGFLFDLMGHMTRASGPDVSGATITRFLTAKNGNKERIAGIATAFAVDPYTLRKVVHSAEGDYLSISDGMTFIPRDFDLWMRCSTELGHRGDGVPILFDRWFSGSALNAQPEKYGECPFGKWDDYAKQEPHLLGKELYVGQVPMMEKIIDEYMATKVGKVEEIGKMIRLLVWNLYCVTSYGVEPSEDTARMLQLFEDHSPEFDYAVRMTSADIPYEWSDKLKREIKAIGDWCWSITEDRKENIEKYKDQTDVLTHMVKNYSEISLAKSEGALRGAFTGGMNNTHSSICGTLITNAQRNDTVYKYLQINPSENIERVLREALRLFTSIPTARKVREQDNFVVDGKRLPTGASVVLSTYAINTDPRSWAEPLKFDPSRFEGTTELGYMCQRGFAPLGAAAELGGRPCGARYHDAHMLRTIIGKLLRDYKFTAKAGGYFDFKQNAGTSMYAGNCRMLVEKR